MIALLAFLFAGLSSVCAAADKVYTNADLKPAPSLDRESRIDPETGKKINNAKDKSAERRDEDGGVTAARDLAHEALRGVRTSKTVDAAIIGGVLLIWLMCLLDILRYEFRGNNKLIWFIAVTFIPLVGCLLYLVIGRKQKKYRIIKDYE